MFNKNQLNLIILKRSVRPIIALLIATSITVVSVQQISRIGKSMEQNRTATYILEKKSDTITNLRASFANLGNADQRMLAAIPQTDDILQFVDTLSALATANAVQQTVKFGNPVPSQISQGGLNLQTVDFTITLNGNVLTLLNYLKAFEKLPYFSGMTSLTMSSPTEKGWDGQSSVNIQGKLYTR